MTFASAMTAFDLDHQETSQRSHVMTKTTVVWVHGCLRCGELNLASFWGSPMVAKLAESRCRHCLSTEMAVCPVEPPSNDH